MWKEKEYLELLESRNTDTVCFMGSGYKFEDYAIGQEFYFPFSWYEVEAVILRGFNIEECLKKMARYKRLPEDRFKIIKKYKFKHAFNDISRVKIRYEYCLIKNLRTKKITHLKDYDVDKFYCCLMAEPI